MKISLNWLRNYVDLEGISPEQIAASLTSTGLEVEAYEDQNQTFKNFVVGKVVKKEKHPKADKLSVCSVFDGQSELCVVCGAPNVAEGQTVIFAKSGAVVPSNGMEIQKIKLRGIESNGMLCSESELNISNDHSGIKILPDSLAAGTPISDALLLNDVLIEIGITPNRPDALSHIGAARDLAAVLNRKFSLPEFNVPVSAFSVNSAASVEILDPVNCPRYSAMVVRNVTVQESPDWLKARLVAVGLRPINNIVDVTNFVLFELGQPLHAFDLDQLAGSKIIVRAAAEGEEFVTLDSQKRKLASSTLMICDAEKPVAVAGVMGGQNSEVTAATKNILIESAYFNPRSIRKTARALGMSTDASYRFERGTDPNITEFAARRAASLIAELCNAEILSGTIDVYPAAIKPIELVLRFARVERILGYTVEVNAIKNIFIGLGISVLVETADGLTVAVPTHRPDIEREIDLIEEIARIYGYDNIPTVSNFTVPLKPAPDDSAFSSSIREAFVGVGFIEIQCNSLLAKPYEFIAAGAIPILNPQSAEMAFLRPSLLPGALASVYRNFSASEKNLMLFEIGNVFRAHSEELNTFDDFTEEEQFVSLISGRKNEKEWYGVEQSFDLFDLKGYLEVILRKIFIENELEDSYYPDGDSIFDHYQTKSYEGTEILSFGKLKQSILKPFGIEQPVYCAIGSITKLKAVPARPKVFKELLRFPKSYRDFAFIFDESVQYSDLKKCMIQNALPILKNIAIFDIFKSETLGSGKKSVAFSLEYYDLERTLTEEEIEKDFQNLITVVEKTFNAQLRGK